MGTNYVAYWKTLPYKLMVGLKWIGFGVLTGILVGGVSALFAKAIVLATGFRLAHTWIVFLLPLAGLFIVSSVVRPDVRARRCRSAVRSVMGWDSCCTSGRRSVAGPSCAA